MRLPKFKSEPNEEIIRRPRSFLAKVILAFKIFCAFVIFCVISTAIIFWQLPKTRPFITNIPNFIQSSYSRAVDAVRDPVKKIEISGNILTPTKLIAEALGVAEGDSLWSFSAQRAYDKIHSLPLVDTIKINVDNVTNTISICVTERKPIALWQSHGQISLINEKGDVIGLPKNPKKAGIDLHTHLPFVVGDDANTLIGPFLEQMKSQQSFLEQAATYSRIGQRRWNITMENGTVLMLPELNDTTTLIHFLKTDQKIHLIDRNPPTIDLRIPGQIIVKKKYAS